MQCEGKQCKAKQHFALLLLTFQSKAISAAACRLAQAVKHLDPYDMLVFKHGAALRSMLHALAFLRAAGLFLAAHGTVAIHDVVFFIVSVERVVVGHALCPAGRVVGLLQRKIMANVG